MKLRSWILLLTANLALLVVSCGDDSRDATTTPTPTPAATAGPVQLKAVSGRGHPVANVDVVFGDAHGAVLQHTQTDAAGTASFAMSAGGMLTVLVHDNYRPEVPHLITLMDLRPGDLIEMYAESGQPSLQGRIVLDFPERRFPPGTGFVQIAVGCQAWMMNPQWDHLKGYVIEVFDYCPRRDDTTDVVVTALAPDYTPLGYSIATGVPLDPATKTTAHFPSGWQTDFGRLVLRYANVPARTPRMSASAAPATSEDASWMGYWLQWVDLEPGTSGARALFYPKLGDKLAFSVQLANEDWRGPSVYYNRLFADQPELADIDLTADIPPFVEGLALINGSTARPGATWTKPAASRADVAGFSISWSVNRVPASWDVMFPPEAEPPIRVPMLPEALASFRPPADPERLSADSFILGDDSSVSGYRGYLATTSESWLPGSWAVTTSRPVATSASSSMLDTDGSRSMTETTASPITSGPGRPLGRSWLRLRRALR